MKKERERENKVEKERKKKKHTRSHWYRDLDIRPHQRASSCRNCYVNRTVQVMSGGIGTAFCRRFGVCAEELDLELLFGGSGSGD